MKKEDKIYILTRSINDYNQDGEYYETYFLGEPSTKQLCNYIGCNEEYAKWIIEFGGRMESENVWYNLR